ncbi:MAG TPA: hypothetical protein VGI39_28190 [Polyangiaceae bacterium]|jgi:hypothetical protein
MRLAPALGFLGLTTLFASAFVVAGCTGDDTNTPVADSGTTGSDATATDGSTPVDGNTPVPDAGPDSHAPPGSDAGDAGDAALPLDCNDYCTSVMNACQGSEAQYQTKDECLSACRFFPVGTPADTTGDTLGCRTYHAVLAATLPNPHCWHAGPYGSGVCGASCDDFCEITLGWCNADAGFIDGGAPPYASLSDCKTACANFALVPVDAGPDAAPPPSAYNAGGTNDTGNTLDCREYHLGLALTNATNQQIHCPHTAAVSAVCQ